jgi:hypothetical protein
VLRLSSLHCGVRKVRLIWKASRALHLELFTLPWEIEVKIKDFNGMSQMRDLLHGPGHIDAGKTPWGQMPAS